ncbi:hypothetical protein F5X99DRAFT_364529 [Biscogniauxia marginata]|nr:hypothetical protein F5X99DRAFT_364529 [Biscogniauxia marginata]
MCMLLAPRSLFSPGKFKKLFISWFFSSFLFFSGGIPYRWGKSLFKEKLLKFIIPPLLSPPVLKTEEAIRKILFLFFLVFGGFCMHVCMYARVYIYSYILKGNADVTPGERVFPAAQ